MNNNLMKSCNSSSLFYFLMCCAATMIILLPVGIANMVFGYILLDSPCTLCWGQRINMIYIGVAAFFVVRYGFKPRYISTILIFAAIGLYESFRHVAVHSGRDLDQGFGLAVFGIHTPFWAEIVFWAVVLLLGVMFFFAPKNGFDRPEGDKPWFEFSNMVKVCIGASAVVIFSNLIQAAVSTGLPPNYGQGDPIRFSWKPSEIIHTSSGLKGMWGKVDFLGPRNVKSPDYAFAHNDKNLGIAFEHDADKAPLAVDAKLSAVSSVKLPVEKPLNTLALINGEYVVSSKFDVFYLDSEFKTVNSMEIDPLFSATIDPIVGVMPWKQDKFVLMGSNKTLLRFEKSYSENPKDQLIGRYSDFIRGEEQFLAGDRGRVETVRAKFHHVMSLTAAGDKYAYMATVPNNRNKSQFVIIKLLQKDMKTSGEFTPSANLKEGRSLGELYVTGMAAANGKLYAVSKNFNVIVEIDPVAEAVTKTFALPAELTDVRGLIVTEDGFQVLNDNALVTLK